MKFLITIEDDDEGSEYMMMAILEDMQRRFGSGVLSVEEVE